MSWSIMKTRDALVEEAAEVDAEHLALRRVEPGRWLVEQHQLRPGGEGTGHADQLALAVRQVRRQAVAVVRQTDGVQCPVDAVSGLGRRPVQVQRVEERRVPPRRLRRDEEVVLHGQVLEQLQRLERAHEPLRRRAGAQRESADVLAVEQHGAGRTARSP